jgi:formylglycine-generating enzyme required for sulfatase activity
MAGNVSEWTSDWYGLYARGAETNPQGPKTGDRRVIRGGSWYHSDADWVRATQRDQLDPAAERAHVGFRCARGD